MKKLLLTFFTLIAIGGYSQTLGSYNILIINSGFGYSTNAQAQFQAMGHTATVVNQGVLDASFNYSPYDVIVFGYNSVPADINPILTLNENCQLGIVVMRADNQVDELDLGASAFWNNSGFQIDNNGHWISQPFSVGVLPLSFTYKSAVTSPTPNTTTLGTVGGLASLLVHNSYNRVVMPYYGHGDGMPWNADAEQLTNRVLCWAASAPCCPATTSNLTVTECNSYTAPSGTVFTNSGIVTDIIPNAAGCDSIITIDLTILPEATGVDTRTECDSYLWIDGNTYTSNNNTATHLIVGGAANGCDSLVTLDLTIVNSNTGTDVVSACDSYLWIDGNTYTSSNNSAQHTLMNAQGCDSVVTLDLTINYSSTGSDIITACDSYQWIDGNNYTSSNNSAQYILTNAQGCDSVVNLDLTITYSNTGTDVVTACDSYLWIDGNTYTSSNNTATYTLTNIGGCDSTVTLNLTITPSPNNNVTQVSTELIADQSGATYQWLDCDDNFSYVFGETGQSFTPVVTGNYAVEVNLNGCMDTSTCYLIDYTGLGELIQSEKELIKIIDVMGRETEFKPNTPLIFIYSDGTIERVMKLEE